MDIDYRETGEHFHEQFYEYTYDLDTIRAALEKHGFVLEKVCDGESFGPLTEESRSEEHTSNSSHWNKSRMPSSA